LEPEARLKVGEVARKQVEERRRNRFRDGRIGHLWVMSAKIASLNLQMSETSRLATNFADSYFPSMALWQFSTPSARKTTPSKNSFDFWIRETSFWKSLPNGHGRKDR